jgi:hypothetical protein
MCIVKYYLFIRAYSQNTVIYTLVTCVLVTLWWPSDFGYAGGRHKRTVQGCMGQFAVSCQRSRLNLDILAM